MGTSVGGRGTQQKNWRDTKSAVLEDRLPKFMSGLIQIAAKKSEETKQRKEEERLREERKRILQQHVEEYNFEKERVSGFRYDPLSHANELKRLDLIQVLEKHGADLKSACMVQVFETWTPEIMDYFIIALGRS